MEDQVLRLLIITKLKDGRLPRTGMPRVFGGHGGGETCVACGERVPKTETMIEGASQEYGRALYFHTQCFSIWDSERRV